MSKRYHTRPARTINKRLIQVLRGKWPDAQVGNVNFFHFWNGKPQKGMINVAWVKDLRSKQLALHGYENGCLSRANKWLRTDRVKFASVDMMVCPTERFAEEVFLWYGRRVPWFQFANYPDVLKPSDAKRRPEIVYIDNGSSLYLEFYSKVALFMRKVAAGAGCKAVLISRRFVNDIKSLARGPLRIETPRHYDHMSSHGLLVNVDSFSQADECLPRKMLYYLHAGIIPLVHGSFTASILYLIEQGVKPLVYYDVEGAIEAITQRSSNYAIPPTFSIQDRIMELRNFLNKHHRSGKRGRKASRVQGPKPEIALNILSASIWDYAGCGYFLSQAVSSTSLHTSHAAVFSKSPLIFPFEFMSPKDKEFERLWHEADVIHVHDSVPKWKTPIHLPKKPTVITHHGSRYRRAPQVYNDAAKKARWVLTASTLDLTIYGPRWLPDCRPDLTSHVDRGDVFTVCHAPTSRVVKNTEQIIKAIKIMDVKFDLIEGRPWAECLARKGRADVLVDQFKLGYGCNSIEAWSMGIPTIGNGPPAVLKLIEKQLGYLPFVKCGTAVSQIRKAIDRLRTDQEHYNEMAKKGHDYWLAIHSPEAVTKRAVTFYREAILMAQPVKVKQLAAGKVAADGKHPGSQGLILLRYVGRNDGEMIFTGQVTGAQYKFGGDKKLGYVDVRDVPAMLQGRRLSRGRKTPVEFKRVEA